ncbi:HNH endonuclease [Stenotrophomonas maltophilia]|nr:HNH endonuclease [Stenotrophomonas maltophilia]
MLDAYGGCCAMTGCDATDALEAAHIVPYRNASSNAVPNGLLLRADIHTLFDLYLIGVDPYSSKLTISPSLRNSVYAELQDSPLAFARATEQRASRASLTWHRAQCDWR